MGMAGRRMESMNTYEWLLGLMTDLGRLAAVKVDERLDHLLRPGMHLRLRQLLARPAGQRLQIQPRRVELLAPLPPAVAGMQTLPVLGLRQARRRRRR